MSLGASAVVLGGHPLPPASAGCSGPHDGRRLGGPSQDPFLSSTSRNHVGALPQKWVSCVGPVNSTPEGHGLQGPPIRSSSLQRGS